MRLHRDVWLCVFSGGVTCGIALASLWMSSIYLATAFVVIGIVLGAAALFVHNERYAFIAALLFFAAAFGVARFDSAERAFASHPTFDRAVGTKMVIEGVVVDEPDVRESTQRLTVETKEVKVLVIAPLYPELDYGDRIRATGTLEYPENFESESGREFNYAGYLKKDGIRYLLEWAQVEPIAVGEGHPVRSLLFALKSGFLENLRDGIPEPHAALMGGLLLGGKQSLGEEIVDDFTRAGVIHIVVLSGFNMTIIAAGIMWLFGNILSARRALLAGAIGIILFMLMAGLSATVVRAGAMALIALLAIALGRRGDALRALFLVGLGMVIVHPHILIYDPSFQLSFVATLGLITLSPHVEQWSMRVPARLGLRDIVVATIATQIAVLPLLLWMTGEFSVVSLPANLLILPAIPITMLLGFLAGLTAFVSSLLALPFAWGAYALLSYELGMTKLAASLPFATFTVPPFSFVFVAATYGFIFYFTASKRAATVSQLRAAR